MNCTLIEGIARYNTIEKRKMCQKEKSMKKYLVYGILTQRDGEVFVSIMLQG